MVYNGSVRFLNLIRIMFMLKFPYIFSFQCRDVHFIDYATAHWFDKSGQLPILNDKVCLLTFIEITPSFVQRFVLTTFCFVFVFLSGLGIFFCISFVDSWSP